MTLIALQTPRIEIKELVSIYMGNGMVLFFY